MVRHTLKSLGPKVLATRMVRDYVAQPLHAGRRQRPRRSTTTTRAPAELAAWKEQVKRGWADVRVEHVESEGVGDAPEVGDALTVRVFVSLGSLTPDDVDVQVVHGRVDGEDALVDTVAASLAPAESYEGGRHRFDGDRHPRPLRRRSATPSGSCPSTPCSPSPPSSAWSPSR